MFALRQAIRFDSPAWDALMHAEPRAVFPSAGSALIGIHDVTNIQYTSGTTGSHKGVLLTHNNLLNNGMVIAQVLRYTHEDRICLPVPYAHCFGNVIGTMAALASGCAMILPSAS